MPFDIGAQAVYKLQIKGADADNLDENGKPTPYQFEVDRLDYPTVIKALKHCSLLAARLEPSLMQELIGKLPEEDKAKIIENLDELENQEYEIIVTLLSEYFPDDHKHRLRYLSYPELVNLFYYMATGNEEIQSLSEIMQELEETQEKYKEKTGLKKRKKKVKSPARATT